MEIVLYIIHVFDVCRKNKKQKENISAATAPISKQKHSSMGLWNPNQNKAEIQNAVTACPQQLNQHTDKLVPPLKYPPKNIMFLMEHIRRGRTGRLHEGMENLHLNRCPCNSDMRGHMNHGAIDASHSRTAQAHFNMGMTGAGYVRVCSKFGTMRGTEYMGLNCEGKYSGDRHQSGRAAEIQANARELINCRKSCKDDDENHWDYIKDGTLRRENCIQGKRFMCASKKQQANGRRLLVDLNMDRCFLGMSCKFGEEYCMDYAEDRNGRRNYNVQESISPVMRPVGWEQSPQSYGGTVKDRVFRSASEMTKYVARDNMAELVGHSKGVTEEGTREKKGHDAANKKGAGSGGNNGKKRVLLSAPPKSGSHQRRPKEQAGK